MAHANARTSTAETAIRATLEDWTAAFTPFFDALLAENPAAPVELKQAVRYSALGPGKRVRPFLVGACCELCGGNREDSFPVAAALECVHAFSLVHDDLPAMDDDDLRRGRPTNHKVFGEAMAVLAGDALLALAFEILVTKTDPAVDRAALVRELAQATGWAGMIGGQALDMLGEQAEPDLDRVREIHDRKTAALIVASCRMGAIAAGAGPARIDAVGRYGRHLGHAFQIVDDLLDVTSTAVEMGKATEKDAKAGKQTYPRVVGIPASRDTATREVERAKEALASFGDAADNLCTLAQFVLERRT
ncbi:MAG: polyprenyl synthetase family protein [Phycisphaerae bacterium]|nr:polyprenyl synthetase family protein [Phycisphaerae bacterium]